MRKNWFSGLFIHLFLLSSSMNAQVPYENHWDIEEMLCCRRVPDQLLLSSRNEIRELREKGNLIVPDTSPNLDQPPSALYFTNGSQPPIFIPEEAGMAYLITGPLRTSWEHQLDPVVSERISIQFRTIEEDILGRYLSGPSK